jgi:hypothetical protein
LSIEEPGVEKSLAQFAVLITFREVFGRKPELYDLRAILSKYQRSEVLFLLAKLNCLLGTWQNTPNFDIDAKLVRALLPDHWYLIDGIRRSNVGRLVFARISFLYLMKQACFMSAESGAIPNTPQAYSEMGKACLMANDLLLPFVPSATDGTLERLANLLPFSDYVPYDHYPMDISRSQEMFDEISQLPTLRARSDFIDVKALFQSSMGLSYRTFSQLVFGCSTKFLDIKIEDFSSPETLILRTSFFQKSTVPSETAQQFFRKMTIPESVLAEKVRNSTTRPEDDFTMFQAFPLIEIARGIYTCLDPGFLVEKAGRGLYWTMFSEIPSEQRGELASFWGAIFETYVNSIIERSYAAQGQFIPEPKFSNGEPAFDACLLEGRRLVVFEHKSSTLRADCKYGGDVAKLKKELDLKFVKGDEEGAKGVAQLNKNLVRFLNGDTINGISSNEIRTVYPTLVCLDSSVVVPYMGRYFKEQFHASFPRRKFRQIVTPVFTLSISDVENLLGFLQSFQLSDIFDSFYSENRSMLTSISSSAVPLLKKAQQGKNVVTEAFSAFCRQMEKDLFGQDTKD